MSYTSRARKQIVSVVVLAGFFWLFPSQRCLNYRVGHASGPIASINLAGENADKGDEDVDLGVYHEQYAEVDLVDPKWSKAHKGFGAAAGVNAGVELSSSESPGWVFQGDEQDLNIPGSACLFGGCYLEGRKVTQDKLGIERQHSAAGIEAGYTYGNGKLKVYVSPYATHNGGAAWKEK